MEFWETFHTYKEIASVVKTQSKVRLLFMLLHRNCDNSPLLIVYNDIYTDQSNCDFPFNYL